MILNLLNHIYSLPFLFGALAGTVLWKIYCHSKARMLDHNHPLPDGQKHAVARMSRQWVAGLVMVGTVGWVLLSTGKAEQRTEDLNRAVVHCWMENYQNTKAQIDINRQNDLITRAQQKLQRRFDVANSDWLKKLIAPPGDLVNKPTNDPERQAYALQMTAEYQGELNDLGRQSDDLVNQRAQLDRQRTEHPLPEATCGRS